MTNTGIRAYDEKSKHGVDSEDAWERTKWVYVNDGGRRYQCTVKHIGKRCQERHGVTIVNTQIRKLRLYTPRIAVVIK